MSSKLTAGARLATRVAAIFALGVAGISSQLKAEQSQRFQAWDPALIRPGSYLADFSSMPLTTRLPEDATAALGGEASVKNLKEMLYQMSPDDRAGEFVRSYEGIVSTFIQVTFFEGLAKRGTNVGTAENVMHLPDGTSIRVPLRQANKIHTALLMLTRYHMAADHLLPGGKPADLQGDYLASVTGTCPIAEGPVAIVQQGYMFEVQSGSKLILIGATGPTKAYAFVNEIRYATIGASPTNQITVDVPDRPSQLLSGGATTDPLIFISNVEGGCVVTLQRESEATPLPSDDASAPRTDASTSKGR